ncbi:MAG: hypothetical protein ABGX83_07780 [Nitrospira sp.]|nr:hypothetical protein [Candidatus Manganitrophaceae bacterium]HIL35490.1 hypothetical protein [Candidatus Manganitrophaceae bacterium]
MSKVVIIGADKSGSIVSKRLLRSTWVIVVVGIVDRDPNALAVPLAKRKGLPISTKDPLQVLQNLDADLVFDLTGDPHFEKKLLDFPSRRFVVVSGKSTQLLWDTIQELEKKEEFLNRRLQEHRVLQKINLLNLRSVTANHILESIVTGMMHMSEMPAGSIVMFNKLGELSLVYAKGFPPNSIKIRPILFDPGD